MHGGYDDPRLRCSGERDRPWARAKKVHIPAADAYGERDEQLVQRIPKENVPDVDDLPVGQTVYMQAPGGQAFPVKVVEITDDDVVFDMNHEMAGKDLNFEITLEEIVD